MSAISRQQSAVSSKSVACIDVGNTSIHLGEFVGRRLKRRALLPVREVSAATAWVRSADQVLVASVNRPVDRRLRHPHLLRMGDDFPPLVKVPRARGWRIGMDRLANASAGFVRAGGACIVVDLGTAITLDAVDGDGRFVGGLIAPGLGLGAWALENRTDALPRVHLRRASRVLARGTDENIRAGVYWSVSGLLQLTLQKAMAEIGRKVSVYGTGSDAPHFRGAFTKVVPTLTLEGIRLSYESFCYAPHR